MMIVGSVGVLFLDHCNGITIKQIHVSNFLLSIQPPKGRTKATVKCNDTDK